MKGHQTSSSGSTRVLELLYSLYCYRAKWTAGYLLVSNVICIVSYTSPLKIRAHGRWKQRRLSAVLTFEPVSIFLCIQSSNADKFKVFGCHGHNLNTDRKRRLFKFRKGIEVVMEGIWSGFVVSAISKWRSALWRRSALPYWHIVVVPPRTVTTKQAWVQEDSPCRHSETSVVLNFG